ncbi:MAG TPA: PadR family transcriptional regulator [Chthoniobacterales bacterium]|jgi:transcriptional regulator
MSRSSTLVQGTLDFLLLKILSVEPLHGFAISRRLGQVSSGVLQVSDGSLYPALHKLEQKGWITAHWKPTENNRRAKFYSLTKLGRKNLARESEEWDRLSNAILTVSQLKQA